MKIVENNLIPPKGFKATNICGVIFKRKGSPKLNEYTIIHESIHTAQIKEMLYIFFYLWYLAEWFIRLFKKGNAYLSISFEREAYDNKFDKEYLKTRKRFSWIKYFIK